MIKACFGCSEKLERRKELNYMADLVLSDKHKLAVDLVLSGKPLTTACNEAGLGTPAHVLPIIAAPVVRQYVRKHVTGRLQLEGAPEAYFFLMSVLRNEQCSKQLRVDVAKFLMSVAGYTPPKAQEPDDLEEKAPSEMTREELMTLIKKDEKEMAEAELARRAKPVKAVIITQDIESLM